MLGAAVSKRRVWCVRVLQAPDENQTRASRLRSAILLWKVALVIHVWRADVTVLAASGMRFRWPWRTTLHATAGDHRPMYQNLLLSKPTAAAYGYKLAIGLGTSDGRHIYRRHANEACMCFAPTYCCSLAPSNGHTVQSHLDWIHLVSTPSLCQHESESSSRS